MITIAIRFLAGRFHATPWGRHVNEGVPEWPPSPWRLLRGLVSTWRRTLPDLPETDVAELLTSLAELPEIHLPIASFAHSRHYMPWDKKGPGDRTLVFDTFAVVDPDERVLFHWPTANLADRQRHLLVALLERMGYFGRSESWCEAALTDAAETANCLPLTGTEPVGADPVQVLVPVPSTPKELLRALFTETGEMRTKERRLAPAGSRWVRYARPKGVLVAHPRKKAPPRHTPVVHVARYALDAKPLPPLTAAIDVGDWARRAMMSQFGGPKKRETTPVISGREDGRPVRDQHQHAFYLPTDEDGDGRIDHLTIYSPVGFGAEEQHALGRLHRLYQGQEKPEIQLLLLGMTQRESLNHPTEFLKESAVWESYTPYVMTRYPKAYRNGTPKLTPLGEQQDGPEDQIRREWRLRQEADPTGRLPNLLSIEPAESCRLTNAPHLRWIQFRRWRSRGGGASTGWGFGFVLQFAGPVAGPIALGYGCHFGLGQFRAVRDREDP